MVLAACHGTLFVSYIWGHSRIFAKDQGSEYLITHQINLNKDRLFNMLWFLIWRSRYLTPCYISKQTIYNNTDGAIILEDAEKMMIKKW